MFRCFQLFTPGQIAGLLIRAQLFRRFINNRVLNLQDIIRRLIVQVNMNIFLDRRIRVLLNTFGIIHARHRQAVLSLNKVTPVLAIRGNFRTFLSRVGLRVHIKDFLRGSLHYVIEVQVYMLMTLLNNLCRLLRRFKVIKGHLITNSRTGDINVTKGTMVQFNGTIRLQAMRVNLRALPDNVRAARVDLITKRHLRHKHTSNRLIRFTLASIQLGRTASRHVKFIKSRHNRDLTIRVLQKFSFDIKDRQAPSNT